MMQRSVVWTLVLAIVLMMVSPAMAEVVSIPNGVSVIADEAFYGDTSITDVTIGEGVRSIGARAFHGCNELKEVRVPKAYLPAVPQDHTNSPGAGAVCKSRIGCAR